LVPRLNLGTPVGRDKEKFMPEENQSTYSLPKAGRETELQASDKT